MHTIRLTSKRQATLPVALCEELGLGPGDSLVLERRSIGDESVWILRAPRPVWAWAGSLRHHAPDRPHRWSEIQKSIEKGFARGDRT